MAKFSSSTPRNVMQSPVQTLSPAQVMPTHERGVGYQRDAKSELFLLSVSSLVEDTFYEKAGDQNTRLTDLVRKIASEGEWQWLYELAVYCRTRANLRSISIVLASEYAKAWQDFVKLKVIPAEAPSPRALIPAVCVRPDEPAELVGYWAMKYGKPQTEGGSKRVKLMLPMSVKKGLAEAARKQYTERNALKYDGDGRAIRMADVIELSHPSPRGAWQGLLFKWLIDRRHGHDQPLSQYSGPNGEVLGTLALNKSLMSMPVEGRRELLRTEEGRKSIAAAEITWEALSGWLQGPMDAEAWEAIIPSMGYMALLRNLRNFQDAKVSEEVQWKVAARLQDPEEVKRSRQLPIRFYNAFLAASGLQSLVAGQRATMHYGGYTLGGNDQVLDMPKKPSLFTAALHKALSLSLANVPFFPGTTLIMVDASGSMAATLSAKSQATRYEYAALFGAAIQQRSERGRLFAYSDEPVWLGEPETIFDAISKVIKTTHNGTNTWESARRVYAEHQNADRLIIITDEQAHDSHSQLAFGQLPIFTFNVAGYKAAHIQSSANSFTVGGLTDAGFAVIGAIEAGMNANWPWQSPSPVEAPEPEGMLV